MDTISAFSTNQSNTYLPVTKKPAKRIFVLILEGMLLLAYASAFPVLYSMMASGEDIKSFFCLMGITELNPATFPDFGWLAPCAAVTSTLFLGYSFAAELIDVLKDSGKCPEQSTLPKGRLYTFGFWATALLCCTLYFLKFGGSSMQYLATLPATPIPGSAIYTDVTLLGWCIPFRIAPIWMINCVIACCFAALGWKRPSGKFLSRLACWFRLHPCLRWMALSASVLCPVALLMTVLGLYLAAIIPFIVVFFILCIIFLPSVIKKEL